MRGGRLIREVVAHGGSTVCVELRQDLLLEFRSFHSNGGHLYKARMKCGGRFKIFLSFRK